MGYPKPDPGPVGRWLPHVLNRLIDRWQLCYYPALFEWGKMKVLIVEDNEDLRNLLARILEQLDCLPILACHGKDGLEKALAQKPDLILMDMLMPVMDGWQAARALRANPETKNIPILATTALFSRVQVKTCLEAGCDGYLVKPFTVLELRRKIAELLLSPLGAV